MWPLQIFVMVLFLRWLADKLPRANLIFALLTAALGVALLPLPFASQRISDALAHGYDGLDNDQWRTAEFLAGEVKVAGGNSLRVEYWLADSQSTAGTSRGDRLRDWFDYVLLHPFDVTNLEGTAAGSGGPAWEVVDTQVGVPDALKALTPVATFGHYAVYRVP
jgi:hypothetical protein